MGHSGVSSVGPLQLAPFLRRHRHRQEREGVPSPLFNSLSSLLLLDGSEDPSTVVLYTVSATVLLLVVVLAAILLAQHRSDRPLNWYEQNLLEIAASSRPNYVHCKALTRLDTDDEREEECQRRRPNTRKQSRIHEINRHSFELPPATAHGDSGDLFTVPKLPRPSYTSSMFQSLDQCQIDRGLYPSSSMEQPTESGYDEKASCGSCGCVKLALWMDPNLSLLTVSLRQATDIVAKRQDGQPNPYFKVALDIPDSRLPKVEHRSKICKGTASPVVSEEFFFQIPGGSVSQCRLEVLVFDYDQFAVDECIGYCSLTLGRLAVLSTNQFQPTILWAEVLPYDEDNGNGHGELLFSLSYLSRAQRLTANIFKARNLRLPHNNGNSHFFSSVAVCVTLFVQRSDRRHKRKKTCSKKMLRNPQFNESLTFNMPKNSLCDSILEFEVIHEHGTFGMASKVLGRLEVPLHKCKELWKAIIHEETAQARWHCLEEP